MCLAWWEKKLYKDRQIIGNGLPKWMGSFINNFSYKNWRIGQKCWWEYLIDDLLTAYGSKVLVALEDYCRFVG